MIKKYISFLLCTFFSLNAAHGQNTFERWYDTLGVSTANCVQETFDGGYVVCGVRWDNLNFANDAAIMKLDSIGNIVWVKTYGSPANDFANHIEQTTDSGYIVYGAYDGGLNTRGWLLKLDANGDTLWTQILTLGPQKIEPTRMGLDTGGYVLTGAYQKPAAPIKAYLIKTDTNGIPQWSKQYGNSNDPTVGYAVQPTFDGGYVIVGETNIGNPVNDDVYLIKTNANGDTLWTKNIGGSTRDIGFYVQQTSDSGYVIVGSTYNSQIASYNLYLIKTNSTGDSLWTRTYNNSVGSEGYCVKETSDGGFIITGRIANPGADVWLVKTDSAGNLLWTEKFGGSGAENGYFVRQTKDGGYIITGSTSSFGSGPGSKLYLIKTDSIGIVYYTGIDESAECTFDNNLIFPNPNNGKFRIKNAECIMQNIVIYNLLGEKIYTANLSEKCEVDISAQPSGIYLIRIQTKNITFSQKIILTH